MRTVNSPTQTAIIQAITRPLHVIELAMPSGALRWSTRETISWNGQTWTQVGANIEALRDAPGGAQEGRIAIQNTDNAASALVLADGISDVPIKIWKLYGIAVFIASDGVLLFDGVCDGAEIALDRVLIDITSAKRVREYSPRVYYTQLCKYLPPAGRVVSWGGEHFVMEPRNG